MKPSSTALIVTLCSVLLSLAACGTTAPGSQPEAAHEQARSDSQRIDATVRLQLQVVTSGPAKSGNPARSDLQVMVSVMDENDVDRVSIDAETATVFVHLGPAGAETLARITRANVDQRLALVVDGEVIMAPVMRETVDSGLVAVGFDDAGAAQAFFERLTRS